MTWARESILHTAARVISTQGFTTSALRTCVVGLSFDIVNCPLGEGGKIASPPHTLRISVIKYKSCNIFPLLRA